MNTSKKIRLVIGIILVAVGLYLIINKESSTIPGQRKLDEITKESLLIKLDNHKYDMDIRIETFLEDREAARFAAELKDFLFDNNYNLEEDIYAIPLETLETPQGDLRIFKPKDNVLTIQVYSKKVSSTTPQKNLEP